MGISRNHWTLLLCLGFAGILKADPLDYWTQFALQPNGWTNGDDRWLSGVSYGNGMFVALGVTVVWTSPDPTWATSTFTSADGRVWNHHELGILSFPTGIRPEGVAYGDGRFVAVGNHYYNSAPTTPTGVVLTSTNGIYWDQMILETNYWLNGNGSPPLVYGSGRFVVAASASYTLDVRGWH
jgi:hypothetical protein